MHPYFRALGVKDCYHLVHNQTYTGLPSTGILTTNSGPKTYYFLKIPYSTNFRLFLAQMRSTSILMFVNINSVSHSLVPHLLLLLQTLPLDRQFRSCLVFLHNLPLPALNIFLSD